MFLTGIQRLIKSALITCVITGVVFLLPVKNVFAVASLTFSSDFQSVDGTRNYMDTAGTWDSANSLDVSNSNPNAGAGEPDGGDTFRLTVDNTAAVGAANRAFDLFISVDLPATNQIRLPQNSNFQVLVNSTVLAGGTSCSSLNNVRANQVGNTVTFVFNSGDELSPRCRYEFNLGLTTNNTVPYAQACNPGNAACDVRFNVAYNQINNTPPLQSGSTTYEADVNAGALTLTKIANTAIAVDGTPVTYNIVVTNTGNGGLFSTTLTDTDSVNFSFSQLTIAPPFVPPDSQPAFGDTTYVFNYLAAGQSTTVVASGDAEIPPDAISCDILNTASVLDRTGTATSSDFDSVSYNLTNQLSLSHDLVNSYCELCGQGEVIVNVTNTGGITLNNVTVTEDLSRSVLGSGLIVVPGSVTFNGAAAPNPVAGPGGTFVWNVGSLDSSADLTPSNPVTIQIRFLVQRNFPTFSHEGLADIDPADGPSTDLSIEATATYESVCGNSPAAVSTGIGLLNLRQPIPTTTKLGWNVDAGQLEGTAAAFVYGHENDDIIWRVEVANSGLADLEDLMVADTIGGNFTFTAVCDNAADATAAANGTIAGTCVARGPGASAAPPFLPLPNPGVDAPQAGSGFVYYVGSILGSCTNATNNTNIEWGCDIDGTNGGIDSTSSIIPLANTLGSAGLSTDVSGAGLPGSGINNALDVQVAVTGINTGQPVGSRGRVTIIITNDTGGTVRRLTMTDVLPVEYVIDPTLPSVVDTASTNPAFSITMIPANGVATYDGMIDRITWTNPTSIINPVTDPLNNTTPQFTLDSTTTGSGAFPDDLLRHGDQLIITFDIVLVDASRYDLLADLDIREETLPATDPDNNFTISNQLTVDFEEACALPEPDSVVVNQNNINANPEDLDVDIVGTNLSFIINTDPNVLLPLTVRVTNNGGHDADNYFLLVTFGAAMEVDTFPAGICTDISATLPSLPRPYWDAPEPVPVNDNPTVFECYNGPIAPGFGNRLDLDFIVSRPSPASAIDDLTFRVDVVGEIQLADGTPLQRDGTPLIFPAVTTTPAAQIDNVANNYSLDAIRARVIGFGLVKSLVGNCTEQASFPTRTANSVFIGEDCQFNIISGGWFGFDTPGFGIIAVHTISVDDEVPTAISAIASAQGYISNTNGAASDAEILSSGIVFTPPPNPPVQPPLLPNQLAQGTVTWTFNVPDTGRPDDNKLVVRDKFFNTNITTRIMNEPLDNSVLPNRHNQLSRNVLNTEFSADFVDTSGNPGVFVFDQSITGYPVESLRRYDLTITEPNLVITKDVCNETLAGGAGLCAAGDFVDFVNSGDTEDFYVYRIRIENVATAPGASRAPAYNVVISDVFDGSDLMQVWPITPTVNPLKDPFNNDGLDNDGDGAVDEGDEAEILTDNLVNIPTNINPAQIKFSYTTSVALEQIDEGEIVYLYYRVNPDDFIAPLQTLTNTLDVRFDSLAGPAGNQNPTQFPIDPDIFPQAPVAGSEGSARVYANTGETSRVQILPLAVEPKIIVQTSSQIGAGPLPGPVDVVVGEEVQYKLRTLIPVANLREFMVRDELPPGITCIEVPTVDLGAAPYDVAGFVPGGVFSVANGRITCNENIVEWNFGDQELTASLGNSRFEFEVDFIGRVENIPTTFIRPFNPNVNNCILRNGGAAASWGAIPPTTACDVDTFVRTSYRNDPTQGGLLIEHLFDPIQVVIREPQLQITKTFLEPVSTNDIAVGDAKNIFDIRVDVVNVGDATAYNPQVLDNLVNTKYTYLGNIGGTDPPVTDAITLPLPGSNLPVFDWGANYTIAPGAANAISFTYRIEANDDVEPLEDVLNTIEAKWTTLENNNVALNTSGAIAVDGDVLGMRNGYFVSTETAPANPVNDYIFDHTDSVVIPGLVITKTDLDAPTTQATIGAQKRFQVDIDLPEGLTNNVLINDNLAFGDVAPAPVQTYVLENNPDFLVQYEFFGIRTINGVAPTPANAESIFNAVPADGTANNAIWNIGLVQTETEDDSPLNLTPLINPRIRIIYYARVNNDVATNNLDLLRNQATLQYTSGIVPPTIETEVDQTDAITVIEPDLMATKVVANLTSPGIDPDAGDVLQYTLTVTHSAVSTSAAYDLNMQDIIPPNLTYIAGTAVLMVNGVVTGIQEPAIVAGQQLIWGRNNLNDETLDIPLTESLLLTYNVRVKDTVQPLEEITNSVVLDWTSLDGSSPVIDARERFGIGGADCSASVAPNDYCYGPVNSTINVIDKNLVVKIKSSDSFNLTPAGTDLRIGDIIEYTLTLSLQEGTTRALTLVDTLPNGVKFVDVTSVNGQALAPYTSANGFFHDPIAAPIIGGPNNKTISWTIGSPATGIINTANDAMDDFIIIYRAVVTKDEFIKPQVATIPVINTVVMNYQDVNGAAPSGLPLSRLTSTVNLNVQQPIIFLADLTKVRRNGVSISGNPVTPNEVMDFQLEACNVGTAPAYNLILEDVIPQYFVDVGPPAINSPLLDIATLTVPIVRINGAIVADGVEYVYVPPPLTVTNPTEILRISFTDSGPLPPGQCATVEFDITVHNLVKDQLNWDNTLQLIEYYSLPAVEPNADVLERQIYDAQGPILYNMNTVVPVINPNKELLTPVGPAYEATIGESITYQIRVPGDPIVAPPPLGGPMQVNMFNVSILDQLSVNTTLVNPLTDVVLDPASQYTGGFTVSVSTTNFMTIDVPLIPFDGTLAVPGTQQAIFNVTVRVNNDANTSSLIAPLTAPFGNSTNFTFGGITTGIGQTANDVNIVEPQLTLVSKQGLNLTKPVNPADTNAGDVIRYTLVIDSTAGGAYSDAFDINIIDQLSASLEFCSAVDGGDCEDPTILNSVGSVIGSTPTLITGSGTIASPYVLNWNSVNGSATDIDIAEGTTNVIITYTVRVMDNVLANQQLVNTATVSWTSLDDAIVGERDGLVANTPLTHLYVSGPLSSNLLTVADVYDLTKLLNSSTSTLAGPNDVRVGDIVDYELRIFMQEGTSANTVFTDTLAQGLQYEGIVSINGINNGNFVAQPPFSHAVYSQLTTLVSGDPQTGPSVVTWTMGDMVNAGDNITTNDTFVIVYRSRVIDLVNGRDLANPLSNIPLQNNIGMVFDTALGAGTGSDLGNIINIQIDQPNLAVIKTLPVGANTVIEADEIVTFYLDVTNSGESWAYDLVLQDTLPVGLRMGSAPPIVTAIEMPIGTPLVPAPIQAYDPVTGIISWDFDTNVANELTIPAGETLRLTYTVQADNNISAGLNITNLAQVLRYHSFDDEELPVPANPAAGIIPPVIPVREIYGPSAVSSIALTTMGPGALDKLNPILAPESPLGVSIGQPFDYAITVPLVPLNTSLYDIRILDDLSAIAGTDLIFVNVTNTVGVFNPVNTGTPFNLVIEDITNGIDTAPMQNAAVALTVMLRNTPNNVSGDTFINIADYTFNSVNGVNASQGVGMPDASLALMIVEPVLEITKVGPPPPSLVRFDVPIAYTLTIENTGNGPAYDTTITDLLPQLSDNPPLTGGTCNRLPENISAQILKDDDTPVATLVQDTDFVVVHTPAPACTLVITTQTPLAVIQYDEKLQITYDAYLDIDSQNGALLTNNVSITDYFSQDTPAGVVVGEIRRYQNDANNPLDDSQYTVTVEAPDLLITKVPYNVTTASSGAAADPGDVLRYTITMQNNGPVAALDFSFSDIPDALNPPPGYFDFATLANVVVPAGAVFVLDPLTGTLNVTGLNLDALGGANNSLEIIFEIQLIPVINSGTVVFNQGNTLVIGFSPQPTDDPAIVGAANPTETLIDAAPAFLVTKTSQVLTGDPAILRQGDTLRYTLLVKNIGLENVTASYLRDVVPANTRYVGNSTTLNGLPVVDLVADASPLESEILINAPEDLTPGNMRADADPNVLTNVATITFDVVVDLDVVDGTVVSNQAYVGGTGLGSGSFAEQASDDPDTSLVNDHTIDVVGNLPALDAQKTVSLVIDGGNNGIVDPGDTLEYQIVVANGGAVAASQTTFVDAIPVNSIYVANSFSLNGTAIADAGLVSLAPLTARINSSDLGLPDQAANDGQVSAGEEAIIVFRVTAGLVPGGLISNQGMITSSELPEEFTDSDGNALNGSQPTDTVIGAASELQITKEVYVVGGGVAIAGGELEYILTVSNSGGVNATNVLLVDAIPANVVYTLGSTKLDGSTSFIGSGVSEPGANLTVNYQLAKGVLEAGEKFTVSYRVVSDSALLPGTEISNTATVTWTEQPGPITDSAIIEIGGAPGVGVVGGNIWHDIIRSPAGQFTGGSDINLAGWTVQLYLNNPARSLFASTLTDDNGRYQFKGVPPSTVGAEYELRIVPPGGSDTSASMGPAFIDISHGTDSGVAGEMGMINISLNPGSNIANQNVPVTPTGVIYDSVIRTPVGGATLRLLQTNGNPVPANCLPAGSNQATQTSLANGFYRFDIQAANCGISNFVVEVNAVPAGYVAGASRIIPAGKAGITDLNVPACSDSANDTILGNNDCDIQFNVVQPDTTVPVRTDSTAQGVPGETQGTSYFMNMRVSANGQVAFNNHIPLDPELTSAISISKVSSMVNVTRSQLVPYTITLTNNLSAPLYDLDVVDFFPAGFKYIAGSGRIQSNQGAWVKTEPLLDANDPSNLTLTWVNIGRLNSNESFTVKLLLVVGSGVGEGEYVNRAQVLNNLTSGAASGIAAATVRVVPDPTFDCSDVIGKVFDDKNLNAYQDEGEEGIPGVRLLTTKGLEITADAYGRFHVTCAVVPNADRGSNFIIKLDERSLPSGYRMTTENPRVVRATRGKMVKFNFGAAIHRVVRLDMAEQVFEPGTTTMRPQWLPRLDILITELAKDPSLLRLSYLADNETEDEVNDRLDAVKEEIEDRWEALDCCYQLMIETEVFWRKGGPVDRGEFDE